MKNSNKYRVWIGYITLAFISLFEMRVYGDASAALCAAHPNNPACDVVSAVKNYTSSDDLLEGLGEDPPSVTSDPFKKVTTPTGTLPPSARMAVITEAPAIDDGINRGNGELTGVNSDLSYIGTIKTRVLNKAKEENLRAILENPNGPSQDQLEDKNVINIAFLKVKKGEPFTFDEANQANDPQIKGYLKVISTATRSEGRLNERKSQIFADLDALGQASAVALKKTNSMKSLGSATTESQSTTSTSNQESGKSSSASKAGGIFQKTDVQLAEEKIKDLESKLAAATSEKDKTKLRALLAAAQAMKKRALLAAKNRKNAAEAQRGLASELSDADKLFAGDLNAKDKESKSSDVSDEKDKSKNLVLAALKEQFSMDSSQTNSEVKRLMNEVEEFSKGETMAGILGSDTLSLFQRIKAFHDGCVRHNCVSVLKK